MPVDLPSGTGSQLQSITYVKDAFNDSENEAALSNLYEAMFSAKAQPREIKETLNTFNGFPENSSFEDTFKQNLQALPLPQLKAICKLFNQHVTGSKLQLAENIITYLQAPTDIKKTYKKGKTEAAESKTSSNKTNLRLGDGDEEEEEDAADEGANVGEEGTTKTAKHRHKKGDKDPDEPKRPVSAYLLFSQKLQPSLIAEMTKEGVKPSVAQISKVVAERWKNLSDDEKAPYVKENEALKAQYQKDLEEYISSGKRDAWLKAHPATTDDDAHSDKKKKDPNAPKRAKSAYIYFQIDYRSKVLEENAGEEKLSQADLMKKLAEKWKELPEEEKQKYEEKAKEDKERYAQEMDEYKSSGKADEFKAKMSEQEKKTSTKKECKGLVKGRPPTASEMEAWIRNYLKKTSDTETISLKQTRKDMEKECGVSLQHLKPQIEKIVNKVAQSD